MEERPLILQGAEAAINSLAGAAPRVRLGYTSESTGVTRWFPGRLSLVEGSAFRLPLTSSPADCLPGSGAYHLAFFDDNGQFLGDGGHRVLLMFDESLSRVHCPFSWGSPGKGLPKT